MSRAHLRGINVIGHLRSSVGLGNTARLFIEVLKANGFEVAGLDIEPYLLDETPELSKGTIVSSVDELPFEHNLIVASIDRLPQLWIRHGRGLLASRFRNAGMIFWELGVVPRAWFPSLAMFDVLVACSHYVRQTIESALPDVPTVFAEHPLQALAPLRDIGPTRQEFGIPSEAVAFCCSFDLRSGLGRKNPLAAIEAWQNAFPNDERVCLVVKLNGSLADNQTTEEAATVIERTRRDPRMIVLSERLPHDRVMALFGCCDVFVSLHRSEGLGLIPMEAMALGKLVVATGYSGNMTFMNEQNSLPVPYRLIEPGKDRPYFRRAFAGPTAAWAEPDMTSASRLLRLAADDAEMRLRIGRKAAEDIRLRQQTAWAGAYLEQMIRYLETSNRSALRKALSMKILFHEIFDPVLRRKNIDAALGRRVWFDR